MNGFKTLKWASFLLIAGAVGVCLFSCRPSPKQIAIGAILPLTGDGAKYGQEARQGIDLAVKDLQQKEGLDIRVVYEDDRGTSTGAVSAFTKLVTTDKLPVVIGPMYSSTAKAVAPLAERYKVVVFSPSASDPALTEAGDYFFRNWPSDIYEGGVVAELVRQKLQVQTVAILAVNLDYGVGLTKVFQSTFESLGGRVVAVEYYKQGATDFRAQLTKLKALQPEAVYLPGYYTEIGLILRQARQLGLRTRFISCVGFDNPKVLEIAGEAAEGVIFARPRFAPNSTDPLVQDFVRRYTAAYGTAPGVYAAHAYDALRIIALAIQKGGYSAEGIKNALYAIRDFPGVTGNTSFDRNGDVIKPIQIMQVKGGTFVPYEQ